MIINKTWPQIHHLGLPSLRPSTVEGLSEGKYSRGWKLRGVQWRLIWKQSFSHNGHPNGVHQQNKNKNRTGPRRAREALGRQNNRVSWYTLQHKLPDWDI